MDNMDILEFARKISMLTTETPMSKAYDEAYGQRENRWWSCQREHLTVWCLHYPTGGVEGFKHTPSSSAKKMYGGFGRPETLLWLAEAVGIDNVIIQNVIDEIKKIKNPRSACAVVRREIPFKMILEKL